MSHYLSLCTGLFSCVCILQTEIIIVVHDVAVVVVVVCSSSSSAVFVMIQIY